MPTIKELEKAARAAYIARTKVEDESHEWRVPRERAALEAIMAEHNRLFGAKIKAAREAEWEANRAHEAAMAKAAAANTGWLPVGTKVFEWVRPGRWARAGEPMRKSGRVGVVEVCTHESFFAGNARYSRPSVGQVFVRLLKKDGSPSLKVVEGWRLCREDWLPEGVSPNKGDA